MGCLKSKNQAVDTFVPATNSRLRHTDLTTNYKLITSTESIHDVYKLESKVIGSGSFGTVRIGTNLTTGLQRAIKTILKDKIKD